MTNPLGLKPGSVLRDNDARSNPPATDKPRLVVVKAVAQRKDQWYALYEGEHRRSRVSFNRINIEDGRPHSQGYTIVKL